MLRSSVLALLVMLAGATVAHSASVYFSVLIPVGLDDVDFRVIRSLY